MLDARTLAIASCCVLVAGVVRGFSGFGFAIGAVPLLGLILDPVRVVPVVMLLQAPAGLRTAWRTRHLVDRRSTGWLLTGALAGLAPGMALLTLLPAAAMRLVIALAVILSVAALGLGWRLRRMPGPWAMTAIGALAGLLNGAVAMPGPPVIAMYLATPTPQAVCRASLVLFFLATGVAGVALATPQGLIDGGSLVLALALAPAMLLGSWLGTHLFQERGARLYRPLALTFLAAVAVTALLQVLHAA